MFTGLVEALGTVANLQPEPPGVRLSIIAGIGRGGRGDRRQHCGQRMLPDRRRGGRRDTIVSSRRRNAEPHESLPLAARQPGQPRTLASARRSNRRAPRDRPHRRPGNFVRAPRRWRLVDLLVSGGNGSTKASRGQGIDRRRRREPDGRRIAAKPFQRGIDSPHPRRHDSRPPGDRRHGQSRNRRAGEIRREAANRPEAELESLET